MSQSDEEGDPYADDPFSRAREIVSRDQHTRGEFIGDIYACGMPPTTTAKGKRHGKPRSERQHRSACLAQAGAATAKARSTGRQPESRPRVEPAAG